MAKKKTAETAQSVTGFIKKVADETKRDDSYEIIKLMSKETGLKPKMWGPSIIGFGTYHYKYDSGHEGDAPRIAFSPRSTAIVLYMASDLKKKEAFLKKFGKHKTTKGCVYIKKLADINMEVLKEMIAHSVSYMKTKYP
jgi:hypothetical protein